MPKIAVCFCYSFVKPKEPASLVLFCEPRAAVPQEEVQSYLKHCMEYAKTYKVYLVPGLFILQDRLCICLISPEGKPVALQKATHLNLLHHAALKPAENLLIFDTPLGRLALLADVDIFRPETARSAAMQGAEVLLVSQFYDLYDLNPIRERSGCWDAAQQNQITVIGVSNLSCCICAPCAATPDGSGYVLPPTTEFPAAAVAYPHKAQKLREEMNLVGYLNPEFCARYFPQLDR